MANQLQVGPISGSDMTLVTARGGKTGETITGQAHGHYYEAVSRGNVYSACTAVAGVAPGTALGTTVPFVLYNPIGNTKNLVVLEVSLGYVSGTLGAGHINLCTNVTPGEAAPTGTAIVHRPRKTRVGSGTALAFTTATVAAAEIVMWPVFNLDASLATTAGVGSAPNVYKVDGGFVVTAGFYAALHGIAAAGSTPLVVLGMMWEEVDA